MANKTISMTKVRQILGYHHQAIGLKKICRLSGVSCRFRSNVTPLFRLILTPLFRSNVTPLI